MLETTGEMAEWSIAAVLCTAIENKTIAKHVGNDWRDGRVVDCGGLENR